MTWRLMRTRRRYHFEKRDEYGGIESYKLRRFATSASARKSVSISAMSPLTNIESHKRTRLRPMPLAFVSLALLSATASPAACFSQGTAEQRLACTPDVFRLCSAFIPNADEITTCLRERNAELSDACMKAIQAEMTQTPGVGDDNGVRKRTAR